MKAKKLLSSLFFILLFAANVFLIIYFYTDSLSFKDWEYYILVHAIDWVYAFFEYKRGNMYKFSTILILLAELAMLLTTFPVFIEIYASYERSLIEGAPPITPFI